MSNARKKRASAAPAEETKADKFVRLGKPRLAKAIKSITLLGNLAGSGYEYTPEQVGKIKKQLTDAMNATLARFDKSGKNVTADVDL